MRKIVMLLILIASLIANVADAKQHVFSQYKCSIDIPDEYRMSVYKEKEDKPLSNFQ